MESIAASASDTTRETQPRQPAHPAAADVGELRGAVVLDAAHSVADLGPAAGLIISAFAAPGGIALFLVPLAGFFYLVFCLIAWNGPDT